MATRIYIDVDGVINAFHDSTIGWSHGDERNATVLGFKIRYNSALIQTLNDLSEDKNFDMVWLTTWLDRAQNDLAPAIGLRHEWRVLTHPTAKPIWEKYDDPYSMTWWKLLAIQKDLEENPTDKFVWIDDEHMWRIGPHRWVQDTHPGTGLTVGTNESSGLTEAQVCDIIDFINGEHAL